jgi:hypothetical protein
MDFEKSRRENFNPGIANAQPNEAAAQKAVKQMPAFDGSI